MSTQLVQIYQSEDGRVELEIRLEQETLWLTQAQIADLFQVKPQNITQHLKNVFDSGELIEAATCKDFLQVHHFVDVTKKVTRMSRHRHSMTRL